MLVLERRRGEVVTIGPNVRIKVLRTAKGGVKLGIQAPDGVRIRRGELEPHGVADGTDSCGAGDGGGGRPVEGPALD